VVRGRHRLKSGKYDHEFHSLRGAAAGMRRLGSGHAGSHRFRVALDFALSGHKEVIDMITQHAAMTRLLGEQLGLPAEVLDALGAAYETWDGRGWPGKLKGAEIPLAARTAQLAEFVEVAYRELPRSSRTARALGTMRRSAAARVARRGASSAGRR
jgi:hypothetical protein